MSSDDAPLITVFTPTFNRAHTLGRLRDSLLAQTNQGFEWLVIDDGSTDDTRALLEGWSREDTGFSFRFVTVPNGGKPRAINKACTSAGGEYLFIVDSDDWAWPEAIAQLTEWISASRGDASCVGVGAVRAFTAPDWQKPTFAGSKGGFVEGTNLKRRALGIVGEMNEAYRVDVLSRYPFRVWPGETFTPEQVTFDEMALDGWHLRWFDEVICEGDYEPDGLSANADRLEARNPMGYSIMANHKLRYARGSDAFRAATQHIALALVGGHPRYVLESNRPWLSLLALPLGIVQSVRRRRQFRERLHKGKGH